MPLESAKSSQLKFTGVQAVGSGTQAQGSFPDRQSHSEMYRTEQLPSTKASQCLNVDEGTDTIEDGMLGLSHMVLK